MADINKIAGVVIDNQKRLMLSIDTGAKYWSFPGGSKNSPQEGDFECLKREFKEEMGIDILNSDTEYYFQAPEFPAANDPGKTVQMTFYFVKLNQEPIPASEVEEIRYFSLSDLEVIKDKLSRAALEFVIPKMYADGVIN